MFSLVEAKVTQAPLVTTSLSEEQSEASSYRTVKEVMVAELFSEDSKIDDFDPHYSTSGVRIGSAGIFYLLATNGAPY